jgi:4-diphosphocytidyl-2-C-methyl-D-erythritol kinase
MISVPAPAKLNLYLHVTGKRDDGYHLLDSLVAFANVHDTISIVDAPGLSLINSGPFGAGLPNDQNNLVLRAARQLQDISGTSQGAEITLTKRLPVASGIGGGSADAAAVIKALVRLWDLHPGQHDLSGLALGLGADVPVCLFGQAAFMSGIGEYLSPVGLLPDVPVVLVNPGVGVSTPAVFKARTGDFSSSAQFEDPPQNLDQLVQLLCDNRTNDLMAPAISLEPVIGETLSAIEAQNGCRFARMSGSGATCFGFFETQSEAEIASQQISAEHPDWWATASRLISDTRHLSAEISV